MISQIVINLVLLLLSLLLLKYRDVFKCAKFSIGFE